MEQINKSNFLLKNWNKFLITIISVLFIFGTFFQYLDKNGELIVNESFTDATIVFGISKGLNAAISLAQGTEVGPPGLTISIGEVLDPINDLVEQFSWIMLAAITSLGLQTILMNFVTGDLFNILLISSIVLLNIWLYVRLPNDIKLRSIFFKITVVLIFLRFSIPIMSIANSFMYENYVKNDYNIELTKQHIEKSSQEINLISNNTIEDNQNSFKEESSFLKDIYNGAKKLISPDYYKDKISQYQKVTEKTGDHIIQLIIAFIFKTIFFPLLFLFFLYKLLKSVFNIGK